MKAKSPKAADAILVFGGDGAMLHAISALAPFCKPFIGIHAGTRGYLMNNVTKPAEFYARLDQLGYERLWLIRAIVQSGRQRETVYGFNDIWVERASAQTLRMYVVVDGVRQPTPLVGDGILFCTPQGSTGYNRALRGKVIPPRLSVLQVTPMSCVMNKNPIGSVILPDRSSVVVEFAETGKRPGNAYCDGVPIPLSPVERISVTRSRRTVRLGFVPGFSFRHKVLSWQFPA